jgi:hypothetical protein
MAGVQKLLKAQSNAASDLFDALADIGTAAGATITIKVVRFSIDIQTPTIDGTPEQTSALTEVYQERFHTGRIEGAASFQGYIISNQAIGLQSYPLEEVDVKLTLGKHLATGVLHKIAFRMAVERTKIDWARTEVGIPIMIDGRITDRYEATGSYPIAETIA